MRRFHDPPRMPRTGESPEERFSCTVALAGTPGQAYIERRGVPVAVADAAGVRFDPDFNGRPAVVVALRDHADVLTALHARYLHTMRGQNKMLTIGAGGGVIGVLGGWGAEPLILVEGLFDALSLATCGWAAVATIGRWVPALPEITAHRVVWLAFDAARPGEADVARYAASLRAADVRRLSPPPGCKDWSTALVKRGRSTVMCWVGDVVAAGRIPLR